MIIFLRDENNKTLCETEIYLKNTSYERPESNIELTSSINIIFYSKKLLELDKKSQRRFIVDIHELSEIRGWYYEHFIHSDKFKKLTFLQEKLNTVENEIYEMYKSIAVQYGLKVVTD